MCVFCRMAISQLQYAAEVIDVDEAVYKFDDIGCMLRFSHSRNLKGATWFVMEYDSRTWLPATGAHFVRSPAIQSPMAGGIIALRDRAKAEEYARNFRGDLLRFGDLGR